MANYQLWLPEEVMEGIRRYWSPSRRTKEMPLGGIQEVAGAQLVTATIDQDYLTQIASMAVLAQVHAYSSGRGRSKPIFDASITVRQHSSYPTGLVLTSNSAQTFDKRPRLVVPLIARDEDEVSIAEFVQAAFEVYRQRAVQPSWRERNLVFYRR